MKCTKMWFGLGDGNRGIPLDKGLSQGMNSAGFTGLGETGNLGLSSKDNED